MAKMSFTDPVLEKIVRRWKWTRNNTILLFQEAQKKDILQFSSNIDKKVPYTFQSLIYQFQCIVTTTDTYFRKITNANTRNYGILVLDNNIQINKNDLDEDIIIQQLADQVVKLENFFKSFTYQDIEEHIKSILTISDHEYLHQGEMILMFRESGVDLPERFRIAWAL